MDRQSDVLGELVPRCDQRGKDRIADRRDAKQNAKTRPVVFLVSDASTLLKRDLRWIRGKGAVRLRI